jgi:hypothetical protein
LEELHPFSENQAQKHALLPVPNTPEAEAITTLLQKWVVDGEIFKRASSLIPITSPILKSEAFRKDREDLSGSSWQKEDMARARPEAAVVIRDYFSFLENVIFKDDREWVLKTDGPTKADIEAVWIPAWLLSLPGALSEEIFSASHFPRVYAFIKRYLDLTKSMRKSNTPERIDGKIAASRVLNSQPSSRPSAFQVAVDESDPLQLQSGSEVEVHPTDSGVNHRDKGILIGLNQKEIVIEKAVSENGNLKHIRLHFPRIGFRVRKAGRAQKSKL